MAFWLKNVLCNLGDIVWTTFDYLITLVRWRLQINKCTKNSKIFLFDRYIVSIFKVLLCRHIWAWFYRVSFVSTLVTFLTPYGSRCGHMITLTSKHSWIFPFSSSEVLSLSLSLSLSLFWSYTFKDYKNFIWDVVACLTDFYVY